MRLPVGIVDCSAARASLARVARIDKQNWNASTSRLVGDELAKLGEGPIAQACALSTAGRNPATNVGQFFQPYRPAGAFRGLNERLRDAVVFVLLEPLLLLREYAEAALGCLRAASLKASAAAVEIGAHLLNALTRVTPSVAVRRDVRYSEINTESFQGVDHLGVIDIADAGKVELALDQHQIDLALAEGEHVALMLAHYDVDLDTSLKRPDGYNVVSLEADYPVIVGLRRVLAELDLHRIASVGLVRGVGVGNLGNAADCNLGRDLELRAGFRIADLVQIKLARLASLEADHREMVAGLIATLKRASEQAELLLRGLDLYVGDELHFSNIEQSACCVNPSGSLGGQARARCRNSYPSPALKGGVSRRF